VGDKLPLILQKIRLHIRNDDLFAYGIDYVQLAKTGIERIDSSGNKIRITQWVIDELGKATKRLKVYAIWVSKLNRDVMARGGSFRPRNSDLYGGDFEYIADIIEFMHRPLAYEGLRGMEREDGYVYKDYDVEHIITKNRLFGGKVGSWWDYQEDEEPSEAPIFDLMKAKMPVLEEGEDLPF
jgi:replicative DNA helicase